MSAMVFKIQQSDPNTLGKEDQISQGTLGENQVLPAGAIANAEQTASENVSDPAAAAPVETATSAEPPVEDPIVAAAPQEAKTATVKIEGPVGRIFTSALNKILAVEGYLTMPTEEITEDIVKGEHKPSLDPDIEVFCWRTNAVNIEEIVHLTNSITKHQERTFVVALESADANVSKMLGVLEDLGKLKNVKLCYSLEKAANVVMEKVRG